MEVSLVDSVFQVRMAVRHTAAHRRRLPMNVNRRNLASRISAWFAQQDDGEFVQLPVTYPYSITVPSDGAQRFVYTTKPGCVAHAIETSGLASTHVVGRGGLPNEEDAGWLRALAGDRVILFLGDCDPADLLVFIWLRSQLRVRYAGVNDLLLEKLRLRIRDAQTIRLSHSEKKGLNLLGELCPDYRALVGVRCAALLDAERKIEIEAVLNFAGAGASLEEAISRREETDP